MRKIIQFNHISLDGFVAGPNGELDWAHVDQELFDWAAERTHGSDSAIYGRKTFELMEGYWPTAGNNPKANQFTIDHSKWYSEITKIVLSNTMKSDPSRKIHVIGKDLARDMSEIKNGKGKEILIFGSPSAGQALAELGLVDGYWLFINPIVLGKGMPLFKGQKDMTKLKLQSTHVFSSGVVVVSYEKI